MTNLRSYQSQLIEDVHNAWDSGARNVLMQLPTGSGKSVLARHVVKRHNGSALLMAHRQEIVSQLSIHLAEEGIQHRIIAPKAVVANIIKIHRELIGKSYMSPTARNVVASVQTIASRGPEDWHNQITLTVLDEVHHYLRENTFGRTLNMFPNTKSLGLTATPQRADRRGLGAHADGLADVLIVGPSMRQLIDDGFLSEYEIVIPRTSFDRNHLVIGSTGDFTGKSLRDESERSQIVGDVIDNYLLWANGTLCVVFAASVAAAEEIAERFRERGVPSEAISGKSNDYERFSAIKRFERREILVLCNCDLLGEGVDVPAIETIIMARATQSLAVYLQQIGRALRPMPDKKRALIIDHVSNVIEHGLPDRARRWTLDSLTKKRDRDPDEIPITACPECLRAYERILRACPYCGLERLKPLNGEIRTIEQVDGDLMLLDMATLARMRESIQLESPASMAERVGFAAGEYAAKRAARLQMERIEAQKQLADAIAHWAGAGRAKGMDDSELYRRFWFTFGTDVLTALSICAKDMNELRERIENA